MIRTTLFAGAAALCFAPMAQAQYNSSYGYEDGYQVRQAAAGCERERDDNRVAGTIIGAVAGGLLGAAIADDDGGHRRHRGYRGHRRHHGYNHNNNGDEVAGALIGGVLGAVVGGEIASSNTNCHTRSARYAYDNIAPPTRQAFAPSQPYRTSAPTYPAAPPVQYPAEQPLYGGPEAQNTPPSQPVRITRTDPVQPTAPAACETVQRETRLPDGTLVREPVSVCQDAYGEWQMQNGEAQY